MTVGVGTTASPVSAKTAALAQMMLRMTAAPLKECARDWIDDGTCSSWSGANFSRFRVTK
jgi:hypothetical protein